MWVQISERGEKRKAQNLTAVKVAGVTRERNTCTSLFSSIIHGVTCRERVSKGINEVRRYICRCGLQTRPWADRDPLIWSWQLLFPPIPRTFNQMQTKCEKSEKNLATIGRLSHSVTARILKSSFKLHLYSRSISEAINHTGPPLSLFFLKLLVWVDMPLKSSLTLCWVKAIFPVCGTVCYPWKNTVSRQ